jgi:hypothetical protein
MVNDSEVEERPRGSLEFVESSVLGTVVPSESNLNIEEALARSVERLDDGNDSPLAAIPQRQALFFGQCLGRR